MTAAPHNGNSPRAAALFQGDAAVCGVGSLPFVSTAAALDFVARWCPEVPFWPQLRRVSPREAMIPQTFGPHTRHLAPIKDECAFALPAGRAGRFLSALDRAEARFDRANAAGFFAFVEACTAGKFPAARALKGQAMGPVTLSCSLLLDGQPLVDREESSVIADYVVRLARWQCEALLKLSPTVLLVFDEAYLGMALRQRPERRAAVVDLLRSVVLRVRRPGVRVGLHCCDEIPLALLGDIAPDLYSFDAFHGGETFASDPAAAAFVAGGGYVAWGWVPTLDDLSGLDPENLTQRWAEASGRLAAAAGVEADRLPARSLVTAACGLAGSSEATCARSFEIARAVSAAFARRMVTS